MNSNKKSTRNNNNLKNTRSEITPNNENIFMKYDGKILQIIDQDLILSQTEVKVKGIRISVGLNNKENRIHRKEYFHSNKLFMLYFDCIDITKVVRYF